MKEKLEALRAVMVEVAEKLKPFDMTHWVGNDDLIEKVTCQTSSCALGWLARDPRGRALGLDIKIERDDGDDANAITYIGVTYNGEKSMGGDFLGDRGAAHFLFIPSAYDLEYLEGSRIPPEAVIRRIDWLLAGGSPTEYDPPRGFV